MEQELVWKMVQGQIGYEFKNLDLLKQAFTRRSYSEENGGETYIKAVKSNVDTIVRELS